MSKSMPLWELLQDPQYLERLAGLGRQAGSAILEVYEGNSIQVSHKQDNSPLTHADTLAHRIIVKGLGDLTPHIPVLSEESDFLSYEQRSKWDVYWLVDPLDGTKEFIEKNGEFTVNIALIYRGAPVFGLVYVPVQDLMYMGVQLAEGISSSGPGDLGKRYPASAEKPGSWASKQHGNEAPERIRVRALPTEGSLTVVASRRHGNDALESCLSRLREGFSQLTLTSIGSSLKICLIAEGRADFYPRLAPTCEWDTAAAQAVLEAAGGIMLDGHLKPLRYNSKDSLLNPDFYAIGDMTYNWNALLNSVAKR